MLFVPSLRQVRRRRRVLWLACGIVFSALYLGLDIVLPEWPALLLAACVTGALCGLLPLMEDRSGWLRAEPVRRSRDQLLDDG